MNKNNEFPLVSVIVITYNSGKYIIETLESIKNQTYKNIELIVSDDCSKDNTIAVCREWIEHNKSRFKKAVLITTHKNTGTAGNANRGIANSSGEWIKFLAGDDILMNDAIENYVNYISDSKEDIKVCFAKGVQFFGDFKEKKTQDLPVPLETYAYGQDSTAKRQYSILKRNFLGSGPSFFVMKKVLESVGGFDERFPLMDDYPLYLKISAAGYKFYLLPQIVFFYRNHSDSVSHSVVSDSIISNISIRCLKDYHYLYKFEHLNWLWKIFLKYSMGLNYLILFMGNSKKNISCLCIYGISLLTDPFIWHSRLMNLFDKIYNYLQKN